MVVVSAVGDTYSRVPVGDSVVCLWTVFRNVIVGVTVPRGSSVISQSSVQISAGLIGTAERILYWRGKGGGGGGGLGGLTSKRQ